MKSVLILASIIFTATVCNAQYSKEKLTDILSGGSSKTWTTKTSETYNFNKNNTVTINGKSEKWELSSADNIRWFITIGAKKEEIIVSYDKSGTQFVKLTSKNPSSSIYTEHILYPSK